MSNTQFKETDENNPAAIKLFESIWTALEGDLGVAALTFPKAIYWLNGAPGAGKGTQTDVILEELGLKSQPIVMSDLLKTPEMEAIKATGQLIDDKTVIGLLFRHLMLVDAHPTPQLVSNHSVPFVPCEQKSITHVILSK